MFISIIGSLIVGPVIYGTAVGLCICSTGRLSTTPIFDLQTSCYLLAQHLSPQKYLKRRDLNRIFEATKSTV